MASAKQLAARQKFIAMVRNRQASKGASQPKASSNMPSQMPIKTSMPMMSSPGVPKGVPMMKSKSHQMKSKNC